VNNENEINSVKG